MSILVFIDLNKNKISESSAQAATIANQLDDKVYGLTTYNDDDYISSLGNKGFDKVFKIDDFKNFDAIKETIINHKINTIVSPNINSKRCHDLVFPVRPEGGGGVFFNRFLQLFSLSF